MPKQIQIYINCIFHLYYILLDYFIWLSVCYFNNIILTARLCASLTGFCNRTAISTVRLYASLIGFLVCNYSKTAVLTVRLSFIIVYINCSAWFRNDRAFSLLICIFIYKTIAEYKDFAILNLIAGSTVFSTNISI